MLLCKIVGEVGFSFPNEADFPPASSARFFFSFPLKALPPNLPNSKALSMEGPPLAKSALT